MTKTIQICLFSFHLLNSQHLKEILKTVSGLQIQYSGHQIVKIHKYVKKYSKGY